MAQDYDKIFKENIEEIILPLAEKLLGIHPEKLEEIPDDLQTTIERKPDFLKKVTHTDSVKNYILHIEFQKDDEPKMAYRMHEYCGILLRKYEIEVRQYVFFIDVGQAKMPTELKYENLQFRFNLLNLQDFDYLQFLKSDKPEEIILAILADFGKDKPETVVKNLIEKLKSLPIETLKREKYVKQLEILSKLRNLQKEIIKQLETMALTYDLKTDIRYLQGKEEQATIVVKKMLADDFTIKQIAKYLEVTTDFVKKIAEGR